MKRIFVALTLVIALAIPSALPVFAAPTSTPDQAMQSVWQRTDQAIDQGKVSRTWIWGPTGFDTKQEAYAESPGGQRTVEYFDKSRMEITNPNGDRNSQWFVTNGLLTKELITGQMQVGDSKFESRSPANIPVAGDPDDTNGPTYATFAGLLSKSAHNVGDQLAETIDKSGNIGTNGPGGVSAAYKVAETNHSVANVFWDFLNSSGTVFNGSYVQGRLFDPTFFATGFPITEAYWAQVKVGGQQKWVLMQAFERRVLTFTPDNPQGWKVEMGNIGRHYHDWRYSSPAQPQPQPQPVDPFADVPPAVSASITPRGGPVGTTFMIDIWGFTPNEEIGFWLTSPDGRVVGTVDTATIGPAGRFDGLPLTTTGLQPGLWSEVFQGVTSHHQCIVYFRLTDPSAPTPPRAPEPGTIAQWSGDGRMQTPLFTTNAAEWVLSWNNINAHEYFGIEIYDANGEYVDLAANTTAQGPGTYYAHNLRGTYYLVIDGTGPWTVSIKAP
jgi:hypothetical protein